MLGRGWRPHLLPSLEEGHPKRVCQRPASPGAARPGALLFGLLTGGGSLTGASVEWPKRVPGCRHVSIPAIPGEEDFGLRQRTGSLSSAQEAGMCLALRCTEQAPARLRSAPSLPCLACLSRCRWGPRQSGRLPPPPSTVGSRVCAGGPGGVAASSGLAQRVNLSHSNTWTCYVAPT